MRGVTARAYKARQQTAIVGQTNNRVDVSKIVHCSSGCLSGCFNANLENVFVGNAVTQQGLGTAQ